MSEPWYQSLSIPASRHDPGAEKRGELELADGTVVEKWVYTAEPGSRIPANLYRPGRMPGKIPVVLMTCGHGDSKSIGHMQYVARTYTRVGVACLLADPLGEEERHPEGRLGTREHDEPWVIEATQRTGRPVMGKLVFDAMRGLDFLETLDWVDRARLGVAGNSLGGAVAGWLWALEPRMRMAMISGWAFGDAFCVYGKHCTRWPNQRMRDAMDWPAFLRLGMAHAPVLILNGDTDVVLDPEGNGVIWRQMQAHIEAADPSGMTIRSWWFPGGGHRPYHGSKRALQFLHEQFGMPNMTAGKTLTLPELKYGDWADRNGISLETLYGVELHYRGAMLPDLGFDPIPCADLSVLAPGEVGAPDYTTAGWLEQMVAPPSPHPMRTTILLCGHSAAKALEPCRSRVDRSGPRGI